MAGVQHEFNDSLGFATPAKATYFASPQAVKRNIQIVGNWHHMMAPFIIAIEILKGRPASEYCTALLGATGVIPKDECWGSSIAEMNKCGFPLISGHSERGILSDCSEILSDFRILRMSTMVLKATSNIPCINPILCLLPQRLLDTVPSASSHQLNRLSSSRTGLR